MCPYAASLLERCAAKLTLGSAVQCVVQCAVRSAQRCCDGSQGDQRARGSVWSRPFTVISVFLCARTMNVLYENALSTDGRKEEKENKKPIFTSD